MAEAPPSDVFTRRICLQLDGMDDVVVRRDRSYGDPDDTSRVMDLYYPGEPDAGARWPVVVIVAGYPGVTPPQSATPRFKDFGWTSSMARLVACSGMAAIAYTNREPVADLQQLLTHIDERAAALSIDATRLGIVAGSGNVPTALSMLLSDSPGRPRCAAFSCGCFLDLDGATDVADAARQFGFANPLAGRSVADLRHDVPLFIARAGRDQFPAMNASTDRFVAHALAENLPITMVNHAEGPHAFDLFDDSETSRGIVRQSLAFLGAHLRPAA